MRRELARKGLAEFIGTALLLIAIIGSGIAAERLSPSDTGLQLFENAAATAAALVAIILAVGGVSGAHLNPVVTLADRFYDRLDRSLDVIEQVLSDSRLAGWKGMGVVVQAYGPRAAFVIDWLFATSGQKRTINS